MDSTVRNYTQETNCTTSSLTDVVTATIEEDHSSFRANLSGLAANSTKDFERLNDTSISHANATKAVSQRQLQHSRDQIEAASEQHSSGLRQRGQILRVLYRNLGESFQARVQATFFGARSVLYFGLTSAVDAILGTNFRSLSPIIVAWVLITTAALLLAGQYLDIISDLIDRQEYRWLGVLRMWDTIGRAFVRISITGWPYYWSHCPSNIHCGHG
jgi:hypothetical protein